MSNVLGSPLNSVTANNTANVKHMGDEDCSTCTYPTSTAVEQIMTCALDVKVDSLIGLTKIMPPQRYDADNFSISRLGVSRGHVASAVGVGKPLPNRKTPLIHASKQTIEPIVIGSSDPIDPQYMMPAVGCNTVDVTPFVGELIDSASDGLVLAMELAIWSLLSQGHYSSLDANGSPMAHYEYKINKAILENSWGDPETDTPISDLLCVLNRLPSCCDWGSTVDTSTGNSQGATIYGNSHTWRCVLMNQNPNDLGGGCCDGGWKFIKERFAAYGLPNIAVYDQQYVDGFTLLQEYMIPTGTLIIVGKPSRSMFPGATGIFRTPGNCSFEAKPHVWVQDNCGSGEHPRKLKVNAVVSTAPILYNPECIVSIQTGCGDLECGALMSD